MNSDYASPFAIALKEAGVMKSNQSVNIYKLVPDYGNYNNIKAIDHTKVDGVDFINIAVSGKTKLGRFLAMDYIGFIDNDRYRNTIDYFVHPVFGKFNTLYNFSVFLRSVTQDDTLRHANTRHLWPTIKNYPEQFNEYVPNELALIAYAMWEKVDQNEEMKNLLTESTLPFDSFRTTTTERVINGQETKLIKYVHTPRSSFTIMVSVLIRDQLIKNKDSGVNSAPDFEFLRDDMDGNVYSKYVILKPITPDVTNDSVDVEQNKPSSDSVLHTEPDTGDVYSETEVEEAIETELNSDTDGNK